MRGTTPVKWLANTHICKIMTPSHGFLAPETGTSFESVHANESRFKAP